MRRHLPLVLAAIATVVVAVTGCATSGAVGFQIERSADFARYRTYDWGAPDALPLTDPRFASNAVFMDHVFGAVDRELRARGLERVTSGDPDLLVHHHVATTRRYTLEPLTRTNTPCADGDCRPTVTTVDEGTLVLDIADARTQRIVWRGWVRDDARAMLRHPDTIDAALGRLLVLLPPSIPDRTTGGW